MTDHHESLFLIDGTAYVYRAYHAMSNLSNSTGEPTGAVYGFANMMNRIVGEQAPKYLVVVFDAKGKTFRDQIYADYKANRPPMPDDLRSQYDTVREMVTAMGISSKSIEGVEADDVIGTLSKEAERQGVYTVIVSSDKDLAQLVTERVIMRDEMRGQELNPGGVVNKFGVPPEKIVDYLALIGDSSDNIPGVSLVGPKTAAKWLETHGSLDDLIANADSLPGKAGENFRNSLQQLDLARRLVTLKTDVDVEFSLADFLIQPPDKETLRGIYERYEFRSWLKELDGNSNSQHDSEHERVTVLDERNLDALVEKIRRQGVFAVDTETTGFDMRQESLVGISVCCDASESYYIPVGHTYLGVPRQLDRDLVLGRMAGILQDKSITKILHNLKFDEAVFGKYGVKIDGAKHDTMLQSYVLNSSAVAQHSLDNVARKYLGRDISTYESVAGKGKKQVSFDNVEIEMAAPYAAEDAEIAYLLHQELFPEIEAEAGLSEIYERVEMPLVPVLSRMEDNGVRIHAGTLAKQSAELAGRMEQIRSDIYEEAGTVFNLSSPKQIQEVLYERLSLPVSKKTSTGQPSTSEDALSELADIYDVPRMILEYRGLFKLKSTYTDRLPELVHPETNRVHTSYNQAVAATGRLSSTNPNLQNIPIRTADGRRVREAFVADSGHKLLAADYSQIELRLMAHLSEDPGLLDAFSREADVHKATAAEVFGVSVEEVTADQRRSAKAINFGLMYGMSAYGLSRQLKIEQSEAKVFMDHYFKRYPKVEAFMNDSRQRAKEQKFVETIFRRRLHVPNIGSRNYPARQHAERTAINAPLQGSAADIIKLAMIRIDEWLRETRSDARIIMQVHDELVLEVPDSAMADVQETVTRIMESAAELKVPLRVESGIGSNWAEAHS